MKEKMNASKILGIEHILKIVVAVIGLVCMVLPYGHYKYLSKTYTFKGLALLFGKSICGGKAQIAPSFVMWLFAIGLIVVIVVTLLSFFIKPIICSEIGVVASIVSLCTSFYLMSGMSKQIPDAKSVGAEPTIAIGIIMAVVLLVIGLRELRDHKVMTALDFMLIPGMLYFIINNYIPMFGIYIAFKDVDYSKGLWGSDWVGMANFKYLFSTSDAFIITRNTLLYNCAFIVLGLLTGCIVGICLAEIFSKAFQKFYQTLILLPNLISMVIVSYIVYAFLSNETGLITKLTSGDINFYATPKFWPFILIFVYIWKNIGYNAIIFLSSIVGIDRGLYEAARVDGATKRQQIFKITLPQLKPTIVTLFLLQVGRIFYSDFGLFYQVPLDAGALYNVTNTVDTYVYRALLVNNNISTASAASTYQAILGFALVLVVNMIVRKVDKENAMF